METLENNNIFIRRRNDGGKIRETRIENGEKKDITKSEEEMAMREVEKEREKIKTKLEKEIKGFLVQKHGKEKENCRENK